MQGLAAGRRIGAEHDPVLILQKEFAGRIRLSAQLRDAGVDIDVEVRILDPAADGGQIFDVVAKCRMNVVFGCFSTTLVNCASRSSRLEIARRRTASSDARSTRATARCCLSSGVKNAAGSAV